MIPNSNLRLFWQAQICFFGNFLPLVSQGHPDKHLKTETTKGLELYYKKLY